MVIVRALCLLSPTKMNSSAIILACENTNVSFEKCPGRNSTTDNNTFHSVSLETLRLVEIIFRGGLTTLMCFIGIPTNVLNCVVFWRQGLGDRMNVCLLWLSFVDCGYLMISLVVSSINCVLVPYDRILGEEYSVKTISSTVGVIYGLKSASNCISMVIAVERCVCVLFPLRASNLMGSRTMAALMFFFFLLFQVLHITYPLSMRAVRVTTAHNVYWVYLTTDLYAKNKSFFIIFEKVLLGATLNVFIFFVIFVTTVVTVTQLRKLMAWRQKVSSTNKNNYSQQMALTRMLVALSSVYIIIMVPYVAQEICFQVLSDDINNGRYYEAVLTSSAIIHTFPRVNSSTHFFVFYTRSSKFRKVCNSLFRSGRMQHLTKPDG